MNTLSTLIMLTSEDEFATMLDLPTEKVSIRVALAVAEKFPNVFVMVSAAPPAKVEGEPEYLEEARIRHGQVSQIAIDWVMGGIIVDAAKDGVYPNILRAFSETQLGAGSLEELTSSFAEEVKLSEETLTHLESTFAKIIDEAPDDLAAIARNGLAKLNESIDTMRQELAS